MAVERVDYSSDEEFEQAQQEERHQDEQEPDAVPCFKCNNSMYQIAELPKDNVCSKCNH